MKKLILAAFFAVATAGFAQPGDREKLSPEQQADLQTKRMTLELGLNDSQQKEVRAALIEQNAFYQKSLKERKETRASGTRPSADEQYKRKSEMLDRQIAHKAKMKKILTLEQFTKWEATKDDRAQKMRDDMGRKDRMRREGNRK